MTSATVEAVREVSHGIVATLRTVDGEREIRAEKILIATGRRPNTDAIAPDDRQLEKDFLNPNGKPSRLRISAARISIKREERDRYSIVPKTGDVWWCPLCSCAFLMLPAGFF